MLRLRLNSLIFPWRIQYFDYLMKLDLDSIRVLKTIVDQGSFAAAAKQFQEIADISDMKLSAVKMRHKRIIDALSKQLAAE